MGMSDKKERICGSKDAMGKKLMSLAKAKEFLLAKQRGASHCSSHLEGSYD